MRFTKYILFLSLLGFIQACSLTKNLKEGEYALFENNLEGVERADEEALAGLIQPETNFRVPLLNVSPGVSIYRVGKSFFDSARVARKITEKELELEEIKAQLDSLGDDRKLLKKSDKIESRIESLNHKAEFGNGLMRTGNPVALLDSSLIDRSIKNLSGFLQNNGFFDSRLDYEVKTKGKKAYVTYRVTEGSPYKIDSVYSRTDNEGIRNLLNRNSSKSFLNAGKTYSQNDIISERNRVEELLKNNGFYMFSKSYLEYYVYTDSVNKKVQIEQRFQKPTFAEKHRVYTVDKINFRVNPPSNEFADRQVNRELKGIDFNFYRDRYSEKILASRVLFKKGEEYNRNIVIESQKQLSNLDLFRFVNITFDTLGNSLTANIFTQPAQKYQLTNQVGLSITEQLPGPFFSTSLRNRNFFRGGEILEFNFRAGLEGVASATNQGVYQSRELGVSGSVIYPRFLIPFGGNRTLEKFGRYNPNTRTQIGYNYTNRPEYTRQGINGLLSYTWSTLSNRQQFTINLADINYIRTPRITPEFGQILLDLANQGNNLIWSFLPSYVSSVSGQAIINFNRYGDFQSRPSSLLRLFVESGGTLLNFTNTENINENTEFANFQWLKLQTDFRRYYPLDRKQTLAYRLNFGIAQPYGVSSGILPYEKYFFAGGGTSIRAWQARRLGPGSFQPSQGEGGKYDYPFEQPSEMIIESMLEYRRNLYGYFDMALFIDIGNSWVIGVDQTRPGADFRFDRFYKELAVGTGIGLRMDFDFLVIRLDLATKAIDPSEPEGERWVLDNISFNRPFGIKGQTVLNFGIGYPF
ncbi:hypothetical protein E4S40_00485 [Algoriphagus kandeliae]|uniref:Uncharacterized protein n=1 Tax=Algoriphagus kandeliae TaxID=2562278 RepID=A0A4Y9R1H2_9BACT|nr:hypothetical protein E4S40_00485 [Algoriphagus kandeliae]